MITDMTKGNPSKVLISFTLPMLLSIVFQQMYNMADSIIAGKVLGVDALAAVGASYPITMIFMAVATGMNVGCSVVISQFFGAGRKEDTKTAIYTSMISSAVLSAILTVLGLVFIKPLISVLQTPKDIFSDCESYLAIYIAGLVFLFLYNICTGIFTALGDSKTPLRFLIASSVANIILDLVLVKRLGVPGVAWATFICQGVAAVCSVFVLALRLKKIETQKAYPKFSAFMLKKISMVSIPSILQQSFVSVGNLFIQGLVNSFSSAVIAGYAAAIKLNTFAVTTFTALGSSMSNFCAQNMGARNIDRIKKGYRVAIVMLLVISAIFSAVFLIFKSTLVEFFMDKSDVTLFESALKTGIMFITIVSPFYFVVALKVATDGLLRGAGNMIAFMTSTFSDLILRVILSYIFVPFFKDTGIWLSWPIGWIISTAVSLGFYFSGKWKNINLTK
ncbi:MAG: MATE family efflux transporter [Clostridia bacterium]|nr:MATE family efflux transporter [Clostridia bacterium]